MSGELVNHPIQLTNGLDNEVLLDTLSGSQPDEMLQLLRIENLALMDSVSLEFKEGYTVVTGETGAGKSILLGALSLLSGARADKSLIRQGTETCSVEAIITQIDNSRLEELLEEMGLPPCDEGQLLIRRVFSVSRASRISINGGMATTSQLREIGNYWVDFHGPGEPQKLFHENEQLALLDLFSGLSAERLAYRKSYQLWKEALAEVDRLNASTRLSPEEAAFLKTQIEEIDRLQLNDKRLTRLEQDYRRISGAQEMRDLCARLDEGFLGSKGICERLQSMLPLTEKLAELDPSTRALSERVESLVIEASDLSGEWRELAHASDFDPRQIRQIESDMEAWMNLRRRYGATVESVLSKRAEMADRLSTQGNIEEIIDKKLQAADALLAHLEKEAAAMRKKRLRAARKLAAESQRLLCDLGFKNPKLSVDLVDRKTLGPNGDCDCRMAFSPNPGNDLLPLRKIASSGEMARVMLALKSVLASVDSTPVLVFDEVDANIGGEVATSVARLLSRLGDNHQVFCITHLPQAASVAKNHYVVRKEQGDASTTVTIQCLDGNREGRLDEFARMLGDRKSDSARRHAEALLENGHSSSR